VPLSIGSGERSGPICGSGAGSTAHIPSVIWHTRPGAWSMTSRNHHLSARQRNSRQNQFSCQRRRSLPAKVVSGLSSSAASRASLKLAHARAVAGQGVGGNVPGDSAEFQLRRDDLQGLLGCSNPVRSGKDHFLHGLLLRVRCGPTQRSRTVLYERRLLTRRSRRDRGNDFVEGLPAGVVRPIKSGDYIDWRLRIEQVLEQVLVLAVLSRHEEFTSSPVSWRLRARTGA
jgi:hypothetical protein